MNGKLKDHRVLRMSEAEADALLERLEEEASKNKNLLLESLRIRMRKGLPKAFTKKW